MLRSTVPLTSYRNSRCLADSWIFPISRPAWLQTPWRLMTLFTGKFVLPVHHHLGWSFCPKQSNMPHTQRQPTVTYHLLLYSQFLVLIPPFASPLSSRQRYVLGDNAMHQMAQSSVFLSGMGGLGIEIGRPQFKMSLCTSAMRLMCSRGVLPALSLTLNDSVSFLQRRISSSLV